jgi:tetratricopeptide (TPR) repeat protein
MADYQQHLHTLDSDPTNEQALSALVHLAAAGDKGPLSQPNAARALDEARRTFRERGELDLVRHLFDVELAAVPDRDRVADLLLEKGRLLFEELFDERGAVESFQRVLEYRPDDPTAAELLAHIGLLRVNWERIVAKYLEEARASTDRQLTTNLFVSVAESYARYRPGAPEIEVHLRKALEVEPKNRRAAAHLERILRRSERWEELWRVLEHRADNAATREEKVSALASAGELVRDRLSRPDLAVEAMRKVLAVDPSNARAMQTLIDAYTAEENWLGLVRVYEGALKARGRAADTELGLYLQIAMTYWKRLEQLEPAEEYFRRVRKLDPAHAAMVDFYRAYHRARGEGAKLLQLLQAAQKAEQDPERRAALGVEIASLAESEVGNPEKAIDSWKAILRQNPRNQEARTAVKRLYQSTEKWNALLELLKEEIEAIPANTEEGKRQRVERLLEVVAIYRDRLKLDVMVINTYNNILAVDPGHLGALDALAQKYEQLNRWNDLIQILQRKADAPATDRIVRAALLRRISNLWTDRFGNQAQAVKPLEDLLALEPHDREAMGKLKDIYARRRQWRALLDLNARETDVLPEEQRRPHLADMARLAAEKLGDTRAAIAIWNRILQKDEADPEALAALAGLYEKEKRFVALVEILYRQRGAAGDDARLAVPLLEKIGAICADKLEAPAQAAEAYQEVLRLAPAHGKAVRVLRDLYAQAGDLDALERLFAQLGAHDDLIEVLHGLVDRTPGNDQKLAILSRIATLAQTKLGVPEKATKAYERILAIDPQNLSAARALVPIYRKAEKWARLLSTYEVLLAHASTRDEQLALHHEIRKLCEEKLGSKALAFQWAARAYELATEAGGPGVGGDGEKLLRDLERLGAEADAWEQVNEILSRRVDGEGVDDRERLRLLRELGRIRASRLHRQDDARAAWERVLKLSPDDNEAMTALEDLATQQARWPDLLALYRRRAELEKDADRRLELLYKIAFIDEERAGNLESAAATYEKILGQDRKAQRAIRALVKVQSARNDFAGLARALEMELEGANEPESRVGLLLRLGSLYEEKLGQRRTALDRFQAALAIAPQSRAVHAALERFLPEGSAERVEVARLLAPVYERTLGPASSNDGEPASRLAGALEILRGAEADPAARLTHDRRLVALYARRLKDPLSAYEAAGRVLAAAPGDAENRREMSALAGELSAHDDLAQQLEKVIAAGRLPAAVEKDLLAELAETYDERLEQPQHAERAWRRVLELDPADPRAYDALERLLRSGERWEDLRAVLEKRVEVVTAPADRREILLQICDLYEGVLENASGAMGAYRRVLEIDLGLGPGPSPSALRAYKALERLYDGAQHWTELEELLGRELSIVRDEKEIVALTFRRAELRATRLRNPTGAVDLAEEVLRREPGHAGARRLLESLFGDKALRLRIARLLGPLYEADGQWADRIRMLQGERELVTPAEAVELLAQIAAIQEERLQDGGAAFNTWRQAVFAAPEDERGRAALERLARGLDRWEEAAETWEQAIHKAPATDLSLRGTLLGELAAIYDRCLGDAKRATQAYRRLIENDPSNLTAAVPAAEALERLHDEQGAWPELIEILRRQAEWADTPERRISSLMRAAEIQERKLGDGAAAIVTWREVLGEDTESRRALDALERLHIARGEARDLIDVLHRRVGLVRAPEEKRDLLGRIAVLQERELHQPGEAIVAWLEVLDHLPDDRATLAELARLYRSGERWADLLEIDERRLQAAGDHAERAALRMELGEILLGRLGRKDEALERFQQILAEDPGHDGARAAVERMLDEPALKLRAAEILQPIYDGRGDHQKLVSLYELEAAAIDDPRERLLRQRKIADLRERHLGDPDGAFDAHARAAREALAEPELADHLAALERLSRARNRTGDLVALYRELAPQLLDAELQRRLYLDIADLARGKLADVELAREYYRRVQDSNPEDPRALAALESLYRETGEHEALRDVLLRKAELHADDADARREALAEIAVITEEKLGRKDEAVGAWEQILEVLPADIEATQALERLYADAARHVDLAELLERRMGFAEDLAEAVDLRYRLGELYEKKLADPERAVENYSAALGGDPQHARSITALERYLEDAAVRLTAAEVLEPIYISRQAWASLIRITEIRLDSEADPANRLALTRRIARLYEEQLEDLEGAFRWYGKVFRENPEDRAIRDQLVRLATILERWDGLANIYQEFLDDESGDPPAVLEVARAAGEVYDRRLGDVERARGAYRRVLAATPEDRDTFVRLEAMLTRASRWHALVESYEEALEASLDDARRKELLGKIAEVQERRLNATDKAIDAYRAVLDLDPDDTRAVDELDRLYQEQKRWHDLAELLTGRIDRQTEPAIVNALRVRLAEVQEHKLGEVGAAIDQYQQVLALEPTPPQALAALERLVVQNEHRLAIAQILEPIYRKQNIWQKLVVILDAQLEFVDDREQRVGMLREIAALHEQHEGHGGKVPLALEALARAWKEDVGDEDVYAELERVATRLGAWEKLVQTLDAGVEGIYDYDLAARQLARIGRIEEEKRHDRTRAIAAWRRVLEVKDDDLDALAALERLHDAEGQHDKLVKVLEQRVELSSDVDERKAVFARIAEIYERSLHQRDQAIAAWQKVQAHDDRDPAALDALERLYRQARDFRSLVDVLSQKIDLATDDATRKPLRLTAAAVFDNELKDSFEAISQYKAILEAEPDDTIALENLDRLYEREKAWPDLVEIIDRRAEAEGDPTRRAELLYRAARHVEKEQGEAEQAIERYRTILASFPEHEATRAALDALTRDEDTLEEAADALEPVYRSEGLYDQVAELYERRLAARTSDATRRRERFEALAQVHETGRRDSGAAFQAWARFLQEEPEDAGAQTELERLAHERGRWPELADLYGTIVEGTMDADLGRSYSLKLAQIYEEAIGDLEKAAGRYRRALELGGDDAGTLAALDRIYERQGRFAELAEVLGREAQAAMSDEEQATFLYRLGEVRERMLGDAGAAIDAYRDVLERVPRHEAARAALERLLGSPAERAQAVAILEPLYEGEGDFARLADLLEHKLTVETSASDRAALLARLTELAEKELNDRVRALDAAGRWLAEDPSSEEAAAELERLAAGLGRWEEAAARLHDVAMAGPPPAEVERELQLRRGRLLLEELRDAERAEPAYRRALDLDRQNATALAALERIYRTTGDLEKLTEILARRGEVEYDVQKKRDFFAEVARLREDRLGDDAGAVSAWRHVLDISESDAEAHERLAALHERSRSWPELVEILETSARFAPDRAVEAARRRRIAEVLAGEMGELDRAVDAWITVADLTPDDDSALLALADVHRRREDWLAVQETLVRRLPLAAGVPGRVEIQRQLAKLAEVERGSPDEAIGYLFQVLDEDPRDEAAYAELERLLSGMERWHDLVDLFQRRAEAAAGTSDEVAYLARAADVWEARLESPEAAAEILEKILERQPGYVPALTRLARIYETAGDWERCGETLRRALELKPTGRDAADLHYRLGRVTEAQGGDLAAALPHYEEALMHDAGHGDATAALERAARERGDWGEVASLLARREASEPDGARRLSLAIELAGIYREKLGRAAEAIPYLERAEQAAPDDVAVAETLAELYFAAGRGADAERLSRKLVEKMRAARRSKDVARHQQRLGALREAANDLPEALKAYEDAFRIDPSNAHTMAGLARIYFANADWEKARRVYRSMLLQNLDPALGISKADVYLALGDIHARLGEGPKARGMYERGLELDPQHERLREALALVK